MKRIEIEEETQWKREKRKVDVVMKEGKKVMMGDVMKEKKLGCCLEERVVRKKRGGSIRRELRKDMEVTIKTGKCTRGSAVRRPKVERLMNNFTITVRVI